MRLSRDVWLLAVLFAGLFGALWLSAGSRQPEENKASTSFNADPLGTKAFYTLLGERLGFDVRRLTVPFDRMPRSAKVLIVVEPRADQAGLPMLAHPPIGEREADALEAWVRAGGTLILAAGSLAEMPEQLTRTGRLGRGRIYAYSSIRKITNKGMRNPANAVELARIVARHAGKRGLVLFDEYHHGYGQPRSLWALTGPRVRLSLIFFAAALGLALYSQGRRFGAVRALLVSDVRRPGIEFVEAVGRLYQRAGAADAAAEITIDSFLRKLQAVFGFTGVLSQPLASRVAASAGGQAVETLRRCLDMRDRLSAGYKPSEQELLNITRDLQHLEKELGLERFYA